MPGLRAHAVPRQPGLADPVDVRAVGGHGRAQPQAGRGDRRRGRGRAHRLLRRRGHRWTPRCARSARACCRCSTRSATTAPWLLLEPTAGQGRSLCAGVDDLEPYLDALDRAPGGRHLPGHLPRVRRRRPARRAGRHHRDRRPARRDRRRRAGCGWCTRTTRWTSAARSRTGTRASATGYIGLGAFEELFAHPATAGVPFVLETPGSRDVGDPQIGLLQKLRERVSGPDRRTTLLATLAAAGRSRPCWGSTFFLIKDLLDRVPVLDFLALRFAIASVALCCSFPRALRPAEPRRRCGTRWCSACCTASRRSCRPPGSPTPRRACPASSPACTSSARRCSPRCCCAPGSGPSPGRPSRSRSPASAVLSLSGLSVGYGEAITLGVRAALRAAHRRASAPGADARPGDGHDRSCSCW